MSPGVKMVRKVQFTSISLYAVGGCLIVSLKTGSKISFLLLFPT